MLAVAGLSQAMGVEPFSGWIPDITTTNGIGTKHFIPYLAVYELNWGET